MTDEGLDQKSAIVLAGVRRLGAVEGFPVTDFALVAETDLDLEQIRGILRDELAASHLELAPGEDADSVVVVNIPDAADALPELGSSANG